MNTRKIRKQNSLTADMEKVVLVWIEDQYSHNILLLKPNPEQVPNSLQFYEG